MPSKKIKKKGVGAEKTTKKTEKNMKKCLKKATGEEDVDLIIKAMEQEEAAQRQKNWTEPAKEEKLLEQPSPRSNFTLNPHPNNSHEMVMFGGESVQDKKSVMHKELYVFNSRDGSWRQMVTKGGPSARCAHQCVVSSANGGQLFLFGGEFSSFSGNQFRHFNDMWIFHFSTKQWQKLVFGQDSSSPPSPRSGHRMILFDKHHIIVFGGFHDNLNECKYFNDLHVYDISSNIWKRDVKIVSNVKPSPRSGCILFHLEANSNRVCLYGGYAIEKASSSKKKSGGDLQGVTLSDMFILTPDKHDKSYCGWRWLHVKQSGSYQDHSSGSGGAVSSMCCVGVPGSSRAFVFGGVRDKTQLTLLSGGMDSDDEVEDADSTEMFNDLYSVNVVDEKAYWNKIEVGVFANENVAKSKLEKSSIDDVTDSDQCMEQVLTPVVVESGAFTVSSTAACISSEGDHLISQKLSNVSVQDKDNDKSPYYPMCPRHSSRMVIRDSHTIFLFAGIYETKSGDLISLRDMYAVNLKKLTDPWRTVIECDNIINEDGNDSSMSDDSDDSEEMSSSDE